MANAPYIGQQEQVGFGIEVTPGTGVAAQSWQEKTSFKLNYKTKTAKDQSGIGRIEATNNSAVTEEYADGTLAGIVIDLPIGYPLVALFGTCTPVLHSGETTVYDNTLSVAQTLPPYLTFTRINPLYTRQYTMGAVSDIEISCKQGEYATFTATISAKVGATTTATSTYVAVPNMFTSKHVTIKLATTLSGLTGATALQPISFKIKIVRKRAPFIPLGVIDPVYFDPSDFDVTGEIVLRYTDTTLEAPALANTIEAMSIALVDTDVTIGTTTNPALTFTMPKTRLTPIDIDDNLDKPITQTVPFSCELDQTSGYLIQAVLTDTQNGYAHA